MKDMSQSTFDVVMRMLLALICIEVIVLIGLMVDMVRLAS